MFPWSLGEFKTRFVILEARAFQIWSQNFNPTRSTKNNLLKSCGHGAFENLAMLVHLVLAILSILHDGFKTAQLGVARATAARGSARGTGKCVNF